MVFFNSCIVLCTLSPTSLDLCPMILSIQTLFSPAESKQLRKVCDIREEYDSYVVCALNQPKQFYMQVLSIFFEHNLIFHLKLSIIITSNIIINGLKIIDNVILVY